MKQIKLSVASLLVLAVAFVLGAGSPVFAHMDGGSGDDSSSTSHKAELEHGAEVESHRSSTAELKQQAVSEVSERRQEHKTQSAEKRQKVCVARKQGLTTKFEHIVSNSRRLQKRIDGIFDKTVAYKESANLSPADWDNVVSAAETAKGTSSASITTLQGLQPSLDCNSTSVASDVATFKASAKETRDNLKAYRDAVKAVVKSVLDVKKTTSDSEGSN